MRAYDRELGFEVAHKTIGHADGDSLLRLKREFRALRDIRHPNLVELIELIEHAGEWLYTMEIVEGEDPLAYVGGDETRLRELLLGLASGIDALHRAGMVHRDIKPSNALVTPEGRVVLLDFGLVASARDGFQSTDVPAAGTVSYMAPEQALGLAAEPASDWYAFGVILYEALTGRTPYEGMTLEILLAKAERPAPEPRELVPTAPLDLSRLCGRLLSVDPRERPTGREVLDCLGQSPAFVDGRGEGARMRDPAFAGRAEELATLNGAAERAFAGAQVAVQVAGAPGIGKSALVTAFARALKRSQPELVVLRGRCDPREHIPYRGFDGVIDELSSHLRRRVPPHRPLSSAVVRLSRIFPVLRRVPTVGRTSLDPPDAGEVGGDADEIAWAMRSILTNVASSRPVLVVLEDAQWLDEDGRWLLDELTHPSGGPPVLLVTTQRTEEAAAGELALGPLALEQTEQLVRACASPSSDIDVGAIARESGGNPFFVRELVALAELECIRAPSTDDWVAARLATLDDAAARLLELCALAAPSVPRSVLVAASGMSSGDAHRCERALASQRLVGLTSRGLELSVYHPLVAEAVRRRLDPARTRSLHQRLGSSRDA